MFLNEIPVLKLLIKGSKIVILTPRLKKNKYLKYHGEWEIHCCYSAKSAIHSLLVDSNTLLPPIIIGFCHHMFKKNSSGFNAPNGLWWT